MHGFTGDVCDHCGGTFDWGGRNRKVEHLACHGVDAEAREAKRQFITSGQAVIDSDWYAPGEPRPWYGVVYGGQRPDSMHQDWDAIRELVLERDDYRCQRCEKAFGKRRRRQLTVHHVIPRDDGGSDSLSNLIALCTHCHDYVECLDPMPDSRHAIIGSTPTDLDLEPLTV